MRRVAAQLGVAVDHLRMVDYERAWQTDRSLIAPGEITGAHDTWQRARAAAALPATRDASLEPSGAARSPLDALGRDATKTCAQRGEPVNCLLAGLLEEPERGLEPLTLRFTKAIRRVYERPA